MSTRLAISKVGVPVDNPHRDTRRNLFKDTGRGPPTASLVVPAISVLQGLSTVTGRSLLWLSCL